MKKIYFSIIFLFVILVISGCGKSDTKVLTCSGVSPGNNMNAASTVKYTFENNINTCSGLQNGIKRPCFSQTK